MYLNMCVYIYIHEPIVIEILIARHLSNNPNSAARKLQDINPLSANRGLPRHIEDIDLHLDTTMRSTDVHLFKSNAC